jgi:NADH dehydrogenase
VAKTIAGTLRGKPREAFEYWDKGAMATIGRKRAIAETPHMKLTGFLAWLAWLFIHVWYLIGFRNRAAVMLNWAWQYVTFKRGARLITGSWVPQIEDPSPVVRPNGRDQAAVAPYATARPSPVTDGDGRTSVASVS